MNPSALHPALRNGTGQTNSSPTQDQQSSYAESAHTGYSPLQHPRQSFQAGTTPNYNFIGSHQAHESPDDDTSPLAGGDPSDPNDLKRPRACEACRQLKVKCELDDSHPQGSCKRCAKANRQCIITAPSRKRQKKTDSRVAELEKKIDALTASLAARGGHDEPALHPAINPPQAADLPQQRNEPYHETQWPQNGRQRIMNAPSMCNMPQAHVSTKRKLEDNYQYLGQKLQTAAPPQVFEPPVPVDAFHATMDNKKRKVVGDEPYIDVIDRQVIDQQTAYRCFERYTAEMCEHVPIVVFQPGTRAEDIRKNKPLLFLATLAASSGTIRPDLQPKFVSELTRTFADRIICRGEKSLELCQALQVTTTFYSPPERYEELNFNQLIHIAAVMALDIGLGKRSRSSAMAVWKEYMDKKSSSVDANATESRRCWLGIYYMCANSAMSLRRPLLIRWSPYSDECMEVLATAPDALPSDKWLCHLVKAQHIAEDVGYQFSMDDPASSLSLTDPTTQFHLRKFERQLKEWRDSSTGNMMAKPLIQHTEAIINLYMHEIAMHYNHNVDDFKPPYNITPLDGPSEPDFVTPAHLESLRICLSSIHNAFDSFLSMDIKGLRVLPTLFYVRTSYAAVALIKMYSAVSAKGSKLGSVFKISDLRVEQYLDRVVNRLTKIAEGGASRVAHKFSFIVNMLKNWHMKRVETGTMSNRSTSNMSRVMTTPYKDAQERDPRTFGWAGSHTGSGLNTQQAMTEQNKNAQNQHRSALQMLSDAAMVKNPQGPHAGMPPMQQGWSGAPTGQTPQPYHGLPGVIDDPSMMGYGPMGMDIDPFAFSAEEMAAVGNLMDDPGWFSFGLEQGGWAF